MRVTFLGTGTSTGVPVINCRCPVCSSGDPKDNRLRPSILLEWDGASVLVDTSTDLRQQAIRHSIARIDALLYTHHHADHILGLDELRLYNWRQKMSIPAFGTEETLAAIRRTFWYVFEAVQAGGGKPALDMRPVEGPFTLLGREVIPVPVLHGELRIYGYRVGSFAYLTDVSKVPDDSMPLLENLDILVVSALRPTPHATHQSMSEAVELSKRIRAGKTLFTHMGHDMPHEETCSILPQDIDLAYDGQVLELEDPA